MAIKKTKNLTWQQQATAQMEDYLKKTKAGSGCLLVMSAYGDLILKTSKASGLDTTTLGSLAASVSAAGEGLGEVLKLRGSPVQFGEGKSLFWFEKISDHWILAGIRCGLQTAAIKTLATYLKKGLSASQKSVGAEVLDGMSSGGLDSKLNERMGGKK